jgi:hypothetical protein
MLNFELPKSTANFLEPGGDGCELRVASYELRGKNAFEKTGTVTHDNKLSPGDDEI